MLAKFHIRFLSFLARIKKRNHLEKSSKHSAQTKMMDTVQKFWYTSFELALYSYATFLVAIYKL